MRSYARMMSYGGARGLNWNPLREGIEIDLMTKSDLVIDFMNNRLCPQHFTLPLQLWGPCNKRDEMSFDSILWDLYQFKRCTLQGWCHSAYSRPCPGRQRFKRWTSLDPCPCFNLHTILLPASCPQRPRVSSWTNLDPGLMKPSLKRSSETSGPWERSRWLIPGVIDTHLALGARAASKILTRINGLMIRANVCEQSMLLGCS